MSERVGWALADTFIAGFMGRPDVARSPNAVRLLQQLREDMDAYREKTLEPRWDKEDEATNGRR